MEKRLLNLRIVLGELGIDTGIETIDRRVTLQKRFTWLKQPGSPCATVQLVRQRSI